MLIIFFSLAQQVFYGKAALRLSVPGTSWGEGRGQALLLNLEVLYSVDHWLSKDVPPICTLPGDKSLLSWLCRLDRYRQK